MPDSIVIGAVFPQRPRELEALCDPRLRATVQAEGIELRSFAGLLGGSLG